MQPGEVDDNLRELESEILYKIRAAYGERWRETLRRHVAETGPVGPSGVDEVVEFFLREAMNFGLLVALEGVSKRAFRAAIIPEIRAKILDLVENALHSAESGVPKNTEKTDEFDDEEGR